MTALFISPYRDDDDFVVRRRAHIDTRARSAFARLPNPYDAVPWQSEGFKIDMHLAGYVRIVEAGCYLTEDGFRLWSQVNEGSPFVRSVPDPDVQRRRDLVPFSDVLREFGSEVAYREARAPAEVIQQQIQEIFAERGYVAEEVRS